MISYSIWDDKWETNTEIIAGYLKNTPKLSGLDILDCQCVCKIIFPSNSDYKYFIQAGLEMIMGCYNISKFINGSGELVKMCYDKCGWSVFDRRKKISISGDVMNIVSSVLKEVFLARWML